MIKELLNLIFGKANNDSIILDDRLEFRLNKNEKILIKKYCDLKHISASEFFRNLAMKEINNFFDINEDKIDRFLSSNRCKYL